jgi:hypothetical protein
LGEFKHYKTRLAHGGIHKEVMADLRLVRSSILKIFEYRMYN